MIRSSLLRALCLSALLPLGPGAPAAAAPGDPATLDAPSMSAEGAGAQPDPGAGEAPELPVLERLAQPFGIINGGAATLDDYPMTGGLLMDADLVISGRTYGVATFICSSTLIAPDVVLLAAHCVDELAITQGQGEITRMEHRWARELDLSTFGGFRVEWPESSVGVTKFVKHEDFNIFRMGLGLADNHDIALLFLDTPVLDTAPALLPGPDEVDLVEVDTEVVVVGWGQQTATSGTQAPPRGTYGIKMMGTSHVAEINDVEMQIGKETSDVRKCHGDSGGPTFQFLDDAETDDPMRLIGVTSHAYDYTDCFRTGGVDTRVSAHLEWIDAQMRAACADGTRVWCEEEGILPTTYNDLPDEEEEVSDEGVDGEEEDDKGGLGCSATRPVGGLGLLAGLGLLVVAAGRRRS